MAVEIVQHKANKQNPSADVFSVTLDEAPIDGATMVAVGGNFYRQTSPDETISITTPASGYSAFGTPVYTSFECMLVAFRDTFASGDTNVVEMTSSKVGNNRPFLFVAEFIGDAGTITQSSWATPAQATSRATGVTGAVANNGSLAVAVFLRNSTTEALGTPAYAVNGTAAGTWVELDKQQTNGTGVEFYIATMPVNAGETVGCTLSGMTSARSLAGMVFVVDVSTTTPPTLSVPGAQTGKYGVAKTITPITPSAGSGTIDQADLTITAGATITVVPSGSANVTGNNTAAVQVTGTQTDVLATIASVDVSRSAPGQTTWFTHDVLTVLITDDNDQTVQDTVAIEWTPTSGVGTANLRFTGPAAGLQDTIAALGWTPTVAGAQTIVMYSETDALSDQDTFNFTVSAAAGGSELGEWLRRRRRR